MIEALLREVVERAVSQAVAPLRADVARLEGLLQQRAAGQPDTLDADGLRVLLGRPTLAALYQHLSRHPDLPVVRAGRKLTASRCEVQRWLAAQGSGR